MGIKRLILFFGCLLYFVTEVGFCLVDSYSFREDRSFEWIKNFGRTVLCDYSIYYGADNLKDLAGVLGAGAILANTENDRSIHHFWQRNVRCKSADRLFRVPMEVGKCNYMRIFFGSMVIGHFAHEYCAGNVLYLWGYRCLRAMLIVSPEEKFITWVIGGRRPTKCEQSRWDYFNYKGVGCSGHGFNGALPILTMAMMTENCYARYGLYILSTLPGISRLNKRAHYFSQIFLGWSLAYLAVRAVNESDCVRDACGISMGIVPTKYGDGVMAYASYRF